MGPIIAPEVVDGIPRTRSRKKKGLVVPTVIGKNIDVLYDDSMPIYPPACTHSDWLLKNRLINEQ